MDQRDQRQRRPSAVDRINSGVDAFRKARTAYKLARTAGTAAELVSTSEIWIPIAIAIVIILIFVIIIIGTTGGGAMDLGGTNPAPGGGNNPSSVASCPVSGGTNSTPSYQADPVNGHCGESYRSAGFGLDCLPNSRRAKAIDVLTGGPTGIDVVLPLIQGQVLQWKYTGSVPQTQDQCDTPVNGSCGLGLVFVADLGNGENWVIHLVHIQSTNLAIGDVYPSGTIVGKTLISHVHIAIGKDIQDPESAPAGSTDIRPGWLAADKDLGMCVPQPAGGGGFCSEGAPGTYCSVQYLQNFFPDPVVAHKMSIICNRESGGGQIHALNKSCLDPNGTLDYSGGLFQVNLLAHWATDRNGNVLNCYNAFRRASVLGAPACADNVPVPPSYCHLGGASPSDRSVYPCHIANQSLVNQCEEAILDPVANVKRAVKLYNEQGFTPWAAAGACNIQ